MAPRLCVTVLIVTYESRHEVGSCLTALRDYASEWIRQVIVVDNASSDGAVDYLREQFPEVAVYRNPQNIGFGSAMNQAAAEAIGEYLLLLNPDCTVQPRALANLVNFLDQRSQAGACGPMMTGQDGQFQYNSRRGFPTPLNSAAYISGLDRLFPRSKALGGYQQRQIDPRMETTTDVLSGACMMVRRALFEQVGGFDADYFLFGDDIDLCWKIRQSGHEIWYIPSAQAVHVKGASMRRAPRMAQREFYHSMRLFIDKRLRPTYSTWSIALANAGVYLAEAWARFRSHQSATQSDSSEKS